MGSHGPLVVDLQQRLNHKLHLGIATDGVFGHRTYEAVRLFQQRNWLAADGRAGPCTLSALNDRDQYVVHRPPVHMVPQPSENTCWAAATAMLLGRNAPVAKPPGVSLNIKGELPNDAEFNSPVYTDLFTRYYGIHYLPPQSWLPAGLAGVMQAHGTLVVNTMLNVARYTARLPSESHLWVMAGIRGDGTAEGTTIRVYDPYPPKRGTIFSVSYKELLGGHPALTYQLWYR
jgi:peptidoglycan hydrolase-like protein with peptidoglycan-binding domain